MAISPISAAPIAPIAPAITTQRASGPAASNGVDFGDALAKAIGDARSLENTANDAATRFAAGDPEVGIHETLIAAEKSSIGLRYAVTLKNRMLEAYRELMNTPL